MVTGNRRTWKQGQLCDEGIGEQGNGETRVMAGNGKAATEGDTEAAAIKRSEERKNVLQRRLGGFLCVGVRAAAAAPPPSAASPPPLTVMSGGKTGPRTTPQTRTDRQQGGTYASETNLLSWCSIKCEDGRDEYRRSK